MAHSKDLINSRGKGLLASYNRKKKSHKWRKFFLFFPQLKEPMDLGTTDWGKPRMRENKVLRGHMTKAVPLVIDRKQRKWGVG